MRLSHVIRERIDQAAAAAAQGRKVTWCWTEAEGDTWSRKYCFQVEELQTEAAA